MGAIEFDGLLASTIAQARADEEDELLNDDHEELAIEMQYDDLVGYIDDYTAAKTQRRAAHGAPRRFCTETAWVDGFRVKVKAPARARQQKQAVVLGERRRI